jgi:hypothetical protein
MVWVATTFKYVFDIRPSAVAHPDPATEPFARRFAYPALAHPADSEHPHHATATHSKDDPRFAYPLRHPHAPADRASLPPDVHFCTADLGWVTGHSYICYGPLVNGAHTVLFEGECACCCTAARSSCFRGRDRGCVR